MKLHTNETCVYCDKPIKDGERSRVVFPHPRWYERRAGMWLNGVKHIGCKPARLDNEEYQ